LRPLDVHLCRAKRGPFGPPKGAREAHAIGGRALRDPRFKFIFLCRATPLRGAIGMPLRGANRVARNRGMAIRALDKVGIEPTVSFRTTDLQSVALATQPLT
jgi:hypothetical protein